jgi:hypothetical protein
MEIAIYPDGGAPPTLLTGEIAEEGMQAGKFDNSRVFDFPPTIGADAVEARDFKNEQTDFSFTIERTWDTPGAAAAYWLTHASTLPRKGRIRFRALEPVGSLVVERWLNGAGITRVSGTFDGCSTSFTYQITGGQITTS